MLCFVVSIHSTMNDRYFYDSLEISIEMKGNGLVEDVHLKFESIIPFNFLFWAYQHECQNNT